MAGSPCKYYWMVYEAKSGGDVFRYGLATRTTHPIEAIAYMTRVSREVDRECLVPVPPTFLTLLEWREITEQEYQLAVANDLAFVRDHDGG